VVAVLIAALAATAPAEAAKTSEREGRKFSRKFMNKEVEGPYRGEWAQRDCYRITRRGVGPYKMFPRGVACLFSQATPGEEVGCYLLAIAVKDGKRSIQAGLITRSPYPYRGDPADCVPDAQIEWPLGFWAGIKLNPLRPVV
jgi:hypothetical protein